MNEPIPEAVKAAESICAAHSRGNDIDLMPIISTACEEYAKRVNAIEHGKKLSLISEVEDLNKQLGPLQKCSNCGEQKHTPYRFDSLGGYVCLTCVSKDREQLQQQLAETQAISATANKTYENVLKTIDELRRENMEWKQICANRDATVNREGERWVRAMTERDAAREELSTLRADVKPLLEALSRNEGRVLEAMGNDNPRVRAIYDALDAFLATHPELKP